MMTIPPQYRKFAYYSIGMGLYGATRGYRSTDHYNSYEKKWEKPYLLIGHRIINTVGNGLFYMWPPVGMVGMLHLVNRVQIQKMEWKSEDFSNEYQEFPLGVYCRDAI